MNRSEHSAPIKAEKIPVADTDQPRDHSCNKLDNKTCLVYDERCMLHKPFDGRDHPERPERIQRIFEILSEYGLVDRCLRLESRAATLEEMQLVHDEQYVKEFSDTQRMEIDDLRLWQENWNSIYACHDTWNASILACGNLLQCVDAVVQERTLNGVAIIRPPGHHAESDCAYGFCFVNNVAVAAKYAQKTLGVGKILILDWDVHHGNGIQNAFYNDRTVLYISLHRYDNGKFFPANGPSNYTDIGEGNGRGFNINIPWNGRGIGDAEYLEAFEKIVMPVAREFNPELVLVSAGFDAARGDPIGGYKITPYGYAQMTAQLCILAGGRIILALEGGYNLTSISESMAACVRILLGDESVEQDEPTKPCSPTRKKTIADTLELLKDYWTCLRQPDVSAAAIGNADIDSMLDSAENTLNAIELLVSDIHDKLNIDVNNSVTHSTPRNDPSRTRHSTGLIFEEEISSKHLCPWDPNHIETPARLSSSLKKIRDRHLMERCVIMEPRRADVAELCQYHNMNFVEQLSETVNWDEDRLESLSGKYDDVYVNQYTYESALIAAGSTVDAVKAVLDGRCKNIMALIRPPGHHAMRAAINGFCIFNNVVIATKMALDTCHLKRILIVDWDVHHGQGTQQAFYNDPRVLYFSIHRYENGQFWPNLRESNWDYIGVDDGKGYNVNVPLNKIGMGDAEFLAIFLHVLLPIATEFNPELIIVSAGYDAAIGCPEGRMEVSPLCYGHLTRMLMALAGGRLCVVLEGGYCLDSLSEGVAMTLRSLLGDYCPKLPSSATKPINPALVEVILNSAHQLKEHWSAMKALCSMVDGNLLRLERPHYNPSDPIYQWKPISPQVYVTKNKYSARPAEVVEHFRTVVEKMMADCSLERTRKKLVIISEADSTMVKTLKAETARNDCQFVEWKADQVQGSSGNADALLGMCSNALDSMRKREVQCGFVAIKETPSSQSIVDIVRYAQKQLGLEKIMIIDLCDHFRGDISRAFYDQDSVLCVSMHKYVWGECGQPENVGRGRGAGYNVNLIWNGKSTSDMEYLFALHHIILPISYSFKPDLVLVVLGFADKDSGNVTAAISHAFSTYLVDQMQMLAEGRLLAIMKDEETSAGIDTQAYEDSIASQYRVFKNEHGLSPTAISLFTETAFNLRPYWPYLQCVLAPNPNVGRPIVLEAGETNSNAGAVAEFLQLPQELGYIGSLHGVMPSLNCNHVKHPGVCGAISAVEDIIMGAECEQCGNIGENWICLTCGKIHCGRYVNEHAMVHSTTCGHPIALSMADLSVWCYLCNSYIQDDAVIPAQRALHLVKFGRTIA